MNIFTLHCTLTGESQDVTICDQCLDKWRKTEPKLAEIEIAKSESEICEFCKPVKSTMLKTLNSLLPSGLASAHNWSATPPTGTCDGAAFALDLANGKNGIPEHMLIGPEEAISNAINSIQLGALDENGLPGIPEGSITEISGPVNVSDSLIVGRNYRSSFEIAYLALSIACGDDLKLKDKCLSEARERLGYSD